MDTVRVLIADDHPLFRRGVRELLEDMAAYTLAGEATSGEEAVAMAAELQPDVVLMDIRMPGLNGIDAARRILAASPHVRVLMVTMFEDNASIFTAMRAGARGYILKDAAEDELLRAIIAVAGRERFELSIGLLL